MHLLSVRHTTKLPDGTINTWDATIRYGRIDGGALGMWASPSEFALCHLRSIYPDYPPVDGWRECDGYSVQGEWKKLDYFRNLTDVEVAAYYEEF